MIQKNNSVTSAETNDDSITKADVTTSSPNNAKPMLAEVLFCGLDKYFEDLQEYDGNLYCSQCNNDSKKTFTYSRTVANGEVFFCHRCKYENLVGNKPNEDDY